MRRIGALSAVFLLLAGCFFPAFAEPHAILIKRLKAELLRQNEQAGRILTRQEIGEFCNFLTQPAAETRQTPSIEVGFYDSPGPATDRAIALGDRIPFILVHGSGSDVISNGEYGRPLNDRERWIHYLSAFNADSAFHSRYKVYRFVYDSRVGIDENGANLIAVIDNISSYPGWEGEDLDGRDFVILAHSMGGLVSRAAMNKQFASGVDAGEYLGSNTINLVTLGTPHHGSPWSIPAWVYDTVLRGSGMTQMEYYFSYILHWGFEPYEGAFDLAWDNYDDAVPLTDITTYEHLFVPTLKDVGGGRDEHTETLLSPYTDSLNDTDMFTGRMVLYCAEDPPDGNVKNLLDLAFCFSLGILNEHHLLGYSFNKLAEVIAGDIGEGGAKPYGMNDGLVPSDSSTFAGWATPYVEIFGNCDHLSLLDNTQVVDSVKGKLVSIALGP